MRLEVVTNSEVWEKYDSYPEFVRGRMLYLRELVIETAEECGIAKLEETL